MEYADARVRNGCAKLLKLFTLLNGTGVTIGINRQGVANVLTRLLEGSLMRWYPSYSHCHGTQRRPRRK